jgi:hypothetical protein
MRSVGHAAVVLGPKFVEVQRLFVSRGQWIFGGLTRRAGKYDLTRSDAQISV